MKVSKEDCIVRSFRILLLTWIVKFFFAFLELQYLDKNEYIMLVYIGINILFSLVLFVYRNIKKVDCYDLTIMLLIVYIITPLFRVLVYTDFINISTAIFTSIVKILVVFEMIFFGVCMVLSIRRSNQEGSVEE